MKVRIDQLQSSAFSQSIYNSDPDGGLIESIRINGVIEPIVIDHNNVIISGHRRVNACRVLGIKEIEAAVTDYSDLLVLEYNRYRQKTYSEILREAHELEKIYRPIAKEKQLASLKQYDDSSVRANLPEREKQALKSLSEVAKHCNMSEKQLQKLFAIESKAPEKIKEIDAGEKSVHQAYQELKEQLHQKEIRTKELSASLRREQENFKQTVSDIEKQSQQSIAKLSAENDQLRRQLAQLQSSLSAVPVSVPSADEIDDDKSISELAFLKDQLKNRDAQIGKMSRDLKELQDKYAANYIHNIDKVKSKYEAENKQLRSQIEELRQELELAKAEPDLSGVTYEIDPDDFNFASIDQVLDYIESNNLYANEQLKTQLEQLFDRIAAILEKMKYLNDIQN